MNSLNESFRKFGIGLTVSFGMIYFLAMISQPVTAAERINGPDDFLYLGSFRLPKGQYGPDTLDYGGLTTSGNVYHDPAHNNDPVLLISGHEMAGYNGDTPFLAKVEIPELRDISNGYNNLIEAAVLEGFTDVSDGRSPLNGEGGVCSFVVDQGDLLGFCGKAYDADNTQSLAAFVGSPDLTTLDGDGPYPVGTLVPQGMMGGYTTLVPPEWREALGTRVVTGNATWSIIRNKSSGPSLHAINADQMHGRPSAGTVIGSTPLAYYPYEHQQLGYYSSNLPGQVINGIAVPSITVTDPEGRTVTNPHTGHLIGGPVWTMAYSDGAMRVHGILFADGTQSVLFFGKKGLGPYCYNMCEGECYEPGSACGTHGDHSYPYANFVWAFDVNEYIKSKNGEIDPWLVMPYTGWTLPNSYIRGVAWDAETRRVYMCRRDPDSVQLVVDVYELLVGSGVSQPQPERPRGLRMGGE